MADTTEQSSFDGVTYWIDPDIPQKRRNGLVQQLKAQGAHEVQLHNPALAERQHPNENEGEGSQNVVNKQPRFDVREVTHIITTSWNIPERKIAYDDTVVQERLKAKEMFFVTPEWVERSFLLGKQNATCYSPDPAMIFSGVTVNCSEDFQEGDVDAIYGAVQTFGGQYRRYPTKELTHLICMQANETQLSILSDPHLGIKVVLPEWIQECIKLRRLVPELPYQFTSTTEAPLIRDPSYRHNPAGLTKDVQDTMAESGMGRLLSTEHTSSVLWGIRAVNAVENREGKMRTNDVMTMEQTIDQQMKVFAGKRVLLGKRLDIDPSTKIVLDEWIMQAGGEAIGKEEDLEECDIYVTKWRSGPEYSKAVRANKTIGTLLWFYHVLKVGKLTSPMDELLHYPVPEAKVEGFDILHIAVTNYTGDSREYVKKLITAMGGSWTNSLSRTVNTHLIAATENGAKVSRSREWGIPVLNHLWLEDCFIKWYCLSPGEERYSSFPTGVNFMSLLGRAHLTEESLHWWLEGARNYQDDLQVESDLPIGAPTQPTPKPIEQATQKGEAEPAAMEVDQEPETAAIQSGVPEAVEQPQPVAGSSRSRGTKNAKTQSQSAPAKATSSGTREAEEAEEEEAPPTKKRRVTDERQKSPVRARDEPAQPATEGRPRRGAAIKAENTLHNNALDMIAFEKEKKRKDIIPPSERKAAQVRSATPETTTTRRRRRSTASKAEEAGDDDRTEPEEEETTVTQKKGQSAGKRKTSGKREKSRSVSVKADEEEEVEQEEQEDETICIIATTSVDLTAAQEKKLSAIPGVRRTIDPTKCTHLIASAFKRTPKFLQALSHAPYIVTKGWIEACIKKGAWSAHEKPHLLKDKDSESALGITLAEVLERAKELQADGGLLKGKTVILIDTLEKKLPASDFSAIIASAGGTPSTPNASKLAIVPRNTAGQMVMSFPADEKHWLKYAHAGIPVFGKEGILGAIFKMKLDMDLDRLDKGSRKK